MERIWEDENNVRKGVYIARVTHQYDYYFVAGNEKDSLVVRKEHALGIADALQKSEGVDLRSDIARLKAENERMREAIENLEENVLHKIDDWANAYPEDVFIEPTSEEWKMLNQTCKDNGLNMTAYSGSIARHCVTGIQKYAKRGLEIAAALSPSTNESEEQNGHH